VTRNRGPGPARRNRKHRPLGPGKAAALVLVLSLQGMPSGAPGAALEAEEGSAGGERKAFSLPGGEKEKSLELTAGAGSVFGKDELFLKDYVDIHYGTLRLQADSVHYFPSTKDCFAEGNVILDDGPARITARKVEYNLDTDKGTFHDAHGYAEPSFYFEAREVHKVDTDRYVILDATFTTCTQPVPYWSFKVSRGTIRLDNYAYLHNVSFRVEKVPAFYSPYLIWPIKKDRASGLLFPEFGFSRRRGFVVTNALYWAIRRNMDATFFLDYYALAGVGEGLEYRYVPSPNGKGQATASFIRDQVTNLDRYQVNLNHRQDLPNDFRLVASFNQLSDFGYPLDFQRDLRLSTNPVVLSNIYLTRNWSSYSLNFRAERRRQIFSILTERFPVGATPAVTTSEEEELTNLIEPKMELRGSRQRLGNSPFYFAFETSLDSFRKQTTLFSTSYQRFDLFPSFSAPLRFAPWIDVNPTLGLRDTYYTRRLGSRLLSEDLNGDGIPETGEDVGLDGVPGTGDFGEGNGILDQQQEIIDHDFVRKILQGSVEVIGPKFSRIFERPRSAFSPMYKNTIEPRVFYLYQSRVGNPLEVIPFDEKDSIAGNQNSIQYSLTTRLFAKRPGVTPGPVQSPSGLSLPEAPSESPHEGRSLPQPPETSKPEKPSLSPVEIASFQIAQTYSLLGPLSRKGRFSFDGKCLDPQCESSNLSALDASLRYNPTLYASVDLKATYDILFNAFRAGSLSANFRAPERGFVDLTWFFRNTLEASLGDSSQLGLLAETNVMNRKLILGFQGNYDVVARALRDQRYRVGYNTQCCGFTVELLDRSFLGIGQQEFRLVVNLKGIGNVLDLNSGSSAIPAVPINF